ncbi:MAG TPA: cupin domain-containing protein, partial [Rhizorhapis sp.]|nr:cupin domain-containing protein [Rhizorhapis sp.]
MNQDPLSSILSLIEARAVYAGGFSAGGDWAIRFPPPEKIKFFAIARGACLLAVDGLSDPYQLDCGDVVLLSAPAPFTIASADGISPVDAYELYTEGKRMASVGQGDDFLAMGGHIDLGTASSRLLI